MEIRCVRQAELEEMVDLQCRVFRTDGHERYGQYIHGDSSYRYGQTRVVVVDGRIVATLRIWDRTLRIGSTPVRMGGIGGVCTHPDHRGRGYASAMMADAVSWMRLEGYLASVLFSEIPTRFYRRLGWGSVPMAGFRLTGVGQGATTMAVKGEWRVEEFDESRDLKQVMALYEDYNRRRSGSLVRTQQYWYSAPARLRGILPSVVVRRGDAVGGYLNSELAADRAEVLEVGCESDGYRALAALADHLVRRCLERGIDEIHGDIPHGHPLVAALQERSGGDLYLTGNSSMMVWPVNLKALFRELLPALQRRLEEAGAHQRPAGVCLRVDEQTCALRVDDGGVLTLEEGSAEASEIALSGDVFWRFLLGEASWVEIVPTVQSMGTVVTAEASSLLSALFPRSEVGFWAPDHY